MKIIAAIIWSIMALVAALLCGYDAYYILAIGSAAFAGSLFWLKGLVWLPIKNKYAPYAEGAYLIPLLFMFELLVIGSPLILGEGALRVWLQKHAPGRGEAYLNIGLVALLCVLIGYRLIRGF